MASTSGSINIQFITRHMSKEEIKAFKEYLEEQKKSFDEDELEWLFAMKKTITSPVELDDINTFETVENTHFILKEVGKLFPHLRVKGTMDLVWLSTDGPDSRYRFFLQDGELLWEEGTIRWSGDW